MRDVKRVSNKVIGYLLGQQRKCLTYACLIDFRWMLVCDLCPKHFRSGFHHCADLFGGNKQGYLLNNTSIKHKQCTMGNSLTKCIPKRAKPSHTFARTSPELALPNLLQRIGTALTVAASPLVSRST